MNKEWVIYQEGVEVARTTDPAEAAAAWRAAKPHPTIRVWDPVRKDLSFGLRTDIQPVWDAMKKLDPA